MPDHLNPLAYLTLTGAEWGDESTLVDLTLAIARPLDGTHECLKALHAFVENATDSQMRFLRGYLTLISVYQRG